jgi:metacaspase-1
MTRIAILAGINAYADAPLHGCLNDVDRLERRLAGYVDSLITLRDDEATFSRLEDEWTRAVSHTQPNDRVILAFSGHGTLFASGHTSSGFPTHLVQAICPFDYQEHWNSPFDDQVLHRCIKDLAKGAKLDLLLDSCHSGGGFRSPVRPKFVVAPQQPDIRWPLPINRFGVKQIGEYYHVDPTMRHLVWSACRSDQTAADAVINGVNGGAFTSCFDASINVHPGETNLQIIEATNILLHGYGYEQIAQLEGPPSMINSYPFL